MAAQEATLERMTKKKPAPRGEGSKKPQGRSPAYTVFARVPIQLGQALEAYVNSTRPRTDKAAVVEVALEDFLTKVGFWPRPADEQKEGQ